MNNRERFQAIVRFEQPDYVPVFGFPGAAGASRSYWACLRRRLVETGMPAEVGSVMRDGRNCEDMQSWNAYWGTIGPVSCDVQLGCGVRGFKTTTRVEGEFTIAESESGAVTRQTVKNDGEYSMPDFIVHPVRDRASWEFYRDRTTPAGTLSPQEFDDACKPYENRDDPLVVTMRGAYGFLRAAMGPEGLSLAFYDDPELVHDMASWHLEQLRRYTFPVIERLRPEVVALSEDLCYNHGMLLSPGHFHEYAGPMYRAVCDVAQASGADLVAVDTDGNAMDFVPIARAYGVGGMYPFEVKGRNDLFAVRRRYPDFVLFGWIEKEVANEGNEDMIESEIRSKAPLVHQGGYFPNADHSLQPLLTFNNVCKFMTVLHDVCGNPEGVYPRAS